MKSLNVFGLLMYEMWLFLWEKKKDWLPKIYCVHFWCDFLKSKGSNQVWCGEEVCGSEDGRLNEARGFFGHFLWFTRMWPSVADLIPICQLCTKHSRADSETFNKSAVNAVTAFSDKMLCVLVIILKWRGKYDLKIWESEDRCMKTCKWFFG